MEAVKLVLALLLLFGGLYFPRDAAAQTGSIRGNGKSGSICVLPNSPDPPTRISPGGDYNPNTLTVRVDNRQSIRWPHKDPVLIEGLDLDEGHLLVLNSDGKRIKSLRFRFSAEDDSRLCLYFDGYQGVQLENREVALWCRAKTRACWR